MPKESLQLKEIPKSNKQTRLNINFDWSVALTFIMLHISITLKFDNNEETKASKVLFAFVLTRIS